MPAIAFLHISSSWSYCIYCCSVDWPGPSNCKESSTPVDYIKKKCHSTRAPWTCVTQCSHVQEWENGTCMSQSFCFFLFFFPDESLRSRCCCLPCWLDFPRHTLMPLADGHKGKCSFLSTSTTTRPAAAATQYPDDNFDDDAQLW